MPPGATPSFASFPAGRDARSVSATPILRVYPLSQIDVETGMSPIGDSPHPSVLHRIPMEVIDMRLKSSSSGIRCSQNRRCHRPRSPLLRRLCEMRSPASMARENCPLIKLQRVEKSELPSGNVQIQCNPTLTPHTSYCTPGTCVIPSVHEDPHCKIAGAAGRGDRSGVA